jgi:DNA-binding IclR family transcriptional regulator
MAANGAELSVKEQQVIDLLKASGEPMDAIAVASQTRLEVTEVLDIFNSLEERGLVRKAQPERVHERFAAGAAV